MERERRALPALHGPVEEGPQAGAAVFAVLGVPGVDVDLAAGRQGAVPFGEPAEVAGGVFDLLGGEAADARRDVAPVRSGPEPGKDVPGREEPDRLGVAGVGDAGQVPGKPALEGADVLVGRWQDSAGHQEFFQVSCCPPGLELVERVVGQRDLPEAELPQHLRGVPWLARAHLQPGQPACGPVHRRQQAEQGRQLGADAAGAVVQEDGEPAGERAAFAEPSAQQLALQAAARAVKGLRELCAGGADRGAVTGPKPWKGTVLAASRAGAPCAHRTI